MSAATLDAAYPKLTELAAFVDDVYAKLEQRIKDSRRRSDRHAGEIVERM